MTNPFQPGGDFRSWGDSNPKRGDQIVYYRRPMEGEHQGWIVYGDSLSGTKLKDFMTRGFQWLTKYGIINSVENRVRFGNGQDNSWLDTKGGPWKPILSHPNGPAEFPVEQVMTLRWYDPKECPVPGTRFPQLEGMKVTQYKCPMCKRIFINVPDAQTGEPMGGVAGLGNHLQIIHKWDRTSLMSYGERVGIDFNAVDARSEFLVEFEAQPKAQEPQAPSVEIETVEAPVLSCECGWATPAGSKNPAASLSMHQRMHCPLKEPAPA